MRWTACRARKGRTPARLAALVATAVCAVLLLVPTDSGARGFALGGGLPSSRLAATSQNSQGFGGVAAVGALFTGSSGKLGSHFCTASVVHSPHGDLAITAAHCVTSKPGQIMFVPGYADGKEPYGVWPVTRVYTDEAWQSSQDPDDDVALLRLGSASDGVPIEDVTGAEALSTDWVSPGRQAGTLVQVIGYPDGANQPVWCMNRAKSFSPTQLEFDCGGYTNGTSGGPFLADVSAVSGQGTVIGVIGGYEQGGDTPQVSYAPVFGTAVASLYEAAEAGG